MTLAWSQYTSDCHVTLHNCGVTLCSCSLDFIFRTLIVLRYAQKHLKYDSCSIENLHFSVINQINLCNLKRPSLFVIVPVLLHPSKIRFTALYMFYFKSPALFILYRSFFFGRHVFPLLLCHSVYIISHFMEQKYEVAMVQLELFAKNPRDQRSTNCLWGSTKGLWEKEYSYRKPWPLNMQNGIKCKLITYGCKTSEGLYFMETFKEPFKIFLILKNRTICLY